MPETTAETLRQSPRRSLALKIHELCGRHQITPDVQQKSYFKRFPSAQMENLAALFTIHVKVAQRMLHGF
jgi:hypothetical protein